MFERMTDAARSAVMLAQEEARFIGCNWAGTEHLLLGLLNQTEGAGRVLADHGVTLVDVRQRVQKIVDPPDEKPDGHIRFTPRAKKALEDTLHQALALGHDIVGTEHMLMALVDDEEGLAYQVLAEVEFDPSVLAASATRNLDHERATPDTVADIDFVEGGKALREWFANAHEAVAFGLSAPTQEEAEGVLQVVLARATGLPLDAVR